MMKTNQFSDRLHMVILTAAGILAVLALAACSGGDEGSAAVDTPRTELQEPTATPAPAPPASPMIPSTAPEPGSDEAQIMAVLEKQVRAVNTADYVSFQESCTPSADELPTLAALKFVFEDMKGAAGGVTTAGQVIFSPKGYNIRNVQVTLLRAQYAKASFEIHDYEKYVSGQVSTKTFEKVDGRWYSESLPCDQG